MKKKIVILLGVVFALVLSFALTACGENANDPSGPKDPEPSAHEHVFSEEWSKNAVYHWHVATCDDTDEVSGKAEHVFADGVCTSCGITVTPTSDFRFSVIEDGYEIVEYTGESDHVIIPETYNNKPIVELSGYLFAAENTATRSYPGTRTVLLSENIKRIWVGTFMRAANLDYIGVNNDNEYFESIDGNLYSKGGKTLRAYALAKRDVYFSIPDGVEKIDKYAMCSPYPISLTIPETVTEIDPDGIKGVKLAEIFNFSGQEIRNLDKGVNLFMSVHPTIYTDKTAKSKLYYIQSDYVVFDDNDTVVLASYTGDETEVVLPQEIGRIEQGAFYKDCKIESIVLDGNVSELDDSSFMVDGLKKVKFAGKIKKIGKVFGGDKPSDIYLGDNVAEFNVPFAYASGTGINYTVSESNAHYKAIDGNLYSKDGKILYSAARKNFKEFVIPEGVETIYELAFYRCVELRSVTIPEGVKSIGSNAFNECYGLTSITIPKNVTSIGDYAFYNCYHLAEVYNLSSLNFEIGSIGYGGIGCYAIDIYDNTSEPSKLTKEGDFVIHTAGSGEKTLIGYFGDKTSVVLPDGVAKIVDFAFSAYRKLTNVKISDSVTEIGRGVFEYCSALTNITIGNGVKIIGEGAFGRCSNLSSVTIPDSVTSIGKDAFLYCGSLNSVTIGRGVTSIGDSAFVGCNTRKVYYKGSEEDWIKIDGVENDRIDLRFATKYFYCETEPTDNGNYWRYVGGVPTVWAK